MEELESLGEILVAEDNEGLLFLIKKILERYGYKVDTVLEGSKAIAQIVAKNYSLVLLDYVLPDMTSKQIIKRVENQKIEVPFVVMTGHGDEEIAVEMMKLGAKDYIVKGEGFIELLPQVVSQVIGKMFIDNQLENAQKALKEGEKSIQAIMKTPVDISLLLDSEGRIIALNDITVERLGMKRDELIGRQVYEFSNVGFVDTNKNGILDSITLGKPFRYEEKREGKIFYNSIYPILDERKKIIRIAFFSKDITKEKLREEKLKSMEKNSVHCKNLKNLGLLAEKITHDYNSILKKVLNKIEILEKEVCKEKESLDFIKNHSLMAKSLCESILNYISDKKILDTESIDINRLINNTRKEIEEKKSPNIVISYNLLDNLPLIKINPSQLIHFILYLLNKLDNIMEDDREIVNINTGAINCSEAYLKKNFLGENMLEGIYVYFEVSFANLLVSTKKIAAMFDPFCKDFILGISVRNILQSSKGLLRINSEISTKSILKILFPAHNLENDVEIFNCDENKTILIISEIDKELPIIKQTAELLNFNTISSIDFDNALDYIKNSKINVIIINSDINIDLITNFMKDINLPAIIINDKSTEILKNKQNVHFLSKSYFLNELIEKIKELCNL